MSRRSLSEARSRRQAGEDPLEYLTRCRTKLHSLWLSLTYPFASTGSSLSIHWTCRLRRPSAPAIQFGSAVVIHKDTWINVSVPAPLGGSPVIIVDDNVSVGARCQISARNLVHIERDVTISGSVLLMDHSHAYEAIDLPISQQGITAGGTIRIGQGCWIGQGAAIICTRGELVLGANCVVGANAVVVGSAPPNSVVCGNPAKVVKRFDPETQKWIKTKGSAPAAGEPVERAVSVAQPPSE